MQAKGKTTPFIKYFLILPIPLKQSGYTHFMCFAAFKCDYLI